MDQSNKNVILTDNPVDIIQEQQKYYEMFGYEEKVFYDSYPSKVFLELKINLLMVGANEKTKSALVDMIWSQKLHRGNQELFMSPIFVCVVEDSKIKNCLTYPLNIKSKKFSIHLLFRIQKCCGTKIDENKQNISCAIFVDEFCRVYKNWEDFRENNKFNDGLVVAPKMGIYNGSQSNNQVLLDIFLQKLGVTKTLDIGSSAIGIISAGVTGVALIPSLTVAPVVLGVATAAGVSCAAYTGMRSIYKLYDRKKHQQSIGLKDNEARSAWFNVGVGVVSASSAGSVQLLARATRNGRNISTLARNSARVVTVGATVLNAGACLDVSIPLFCALFNSKWDDNTLMQVAQLSTALFLFSHSVHNFKMAEQIMANRNEAVDSLLCLIQKDSFRSLVNQTMNVCGTVLQPIVRSLKNTVTDPKVILFLIRQFNITNDAKMAEKFENLLKEFCGKVGSGIKNEYCREFDKYLLNIIRELEKKLKIRDLNRLLKPIINLLKEITFKACNKILTFFQEIFVEMAESIKWQKNYIERLLKMIHIMFSNQSIIRHAELNDFVLSENNDDLQLIKCEIHEIVSKDTTGSLTELDTIYDNKFGSDVDLNEIRKLDLLINEYADEYTAEFAKCSAATEIKVLHETIVSILKQLPYDIAKKYFNLAKKLIIDHAKSIQMSLGRFISVDIFIVEIYRMLSKFSAINDFESLTAYLSMYSDDFYDSVEELFKKHYEIKHDASLKKICCPTCKGDVFVLKS